MRLADYVMNFLADHGIDASFLVTGGFAMHLNDALGGERRIRKIFCHHEQGAAYAAEGYAHIAEKPALVQVTAGPGSINAMSGVFGAYTDSIPMIVVSGQGKRGVIRSTYGFEEMRMICDQEADIIKMVRPITKYAREVMDPERIAFELEKAFYLASHGRPGPVWLQIPLDVQSVDISPENLAHYPHFDSSRQDAFGLAENISERLRAAKRPLVVVGPDLPDSLRERFHLLIKRWGCPVVGAGAQDSIMNDHPQYAGRMGIVGTRAGNLSITNADVILFFGMRPYLGFVTYAWENMGKNAWKIVVDDDPNEFEKPCAIADQGVVCDTSQLIDALIKISDAQAGDAWGNWRAQCRQTVQELDVLPDSLRTVNGEGAINPYWFAECLSECLRPDDIIVAGNASSSVIPLQITAFKSSQRMFSNHGNGAMGFALPAAIGASVAAPGSRIICLEGDGSLMMNLQELQTAVNYNLPLAVIIFNNGGYASIRQSQKTFANQVGYSASTGISFPEFAKVASAFDIPSVRISGSSFKADLAQAMERRGPILIDVLLESEQGFEPKVASRRQPDGTMISSPPWDMAPFLPREVLSRYIYKKDGDK